MYKDLLTYLWKNKAWWLVPPVIVFIIFGGLVLLSSSSAVSPFIYMLF